MKIYLISLGLLLIGIVSGITLQNERDRKTREILNKLKEKK